MRAPRGRRVGSTHSGGWGTGKMTSFPRMARVFGAPRGRRVETEPELPSNTTYRVNVNFKTSVFFFKTSVFKTWVFSLHKKHVQKRITFVQYGIVFLRRLIINTPKSIQLIEEVEIVRTINSHYLRGKEGYAILAEKFCSLGNNGVSNYEEPVLAGDKEDT